MGYHPPRSPFPPQLPGEPRAAYIARRLRVSLREPWPDSVRLAVEALASSLEREARAERLSNGPTQRVYDAISKSRATRPPLTAPPGPGHKVSS